MLLIPTYMFALLIAHQWLGVILIRAFTPDEKIANAEPGTTAECKGKGYLCDKCPRAAFITFKGAAFEYFFIEILVYTCYGISMLLYMVRSRFTKVGEDVGSQFESTYLCLMANKLSGIIDISMKNPVQYYAGVERIVNIGGAIELKTNLSKKAISEIVKQKEIDEKDAADWIKNNVVGCITKN